MQRLNLSFWKKKDFEEARETKLYPHFLAYVKKEYDYRVESWATFVRIESQLPTRGSNTNNYVEISMRLTKEKVFRSELA